MKRKRVTAKRVLALTLALVLNFTTVFGAGGMTTVYAEENAEVTTEVVEETEEAETESIVEADAEESSLEEESVEEVVESEEETTEEETETQTQEETTDEVLAAENEIMLMNTREMWSEADLMNFDFNANTKDKIIDQKTYVETIENGKSVKIEIYNKDGSLKSMSVTNAGLTANDWNEGDYFLISFSTKHFKENIISFSMRSSNTGPKDFKATYKVNDGDEKVLVDAIAITSTSLNVVCNEKQLDGADEAEQVEIKITCTSKVACKNDGSLVQKNGTSNVDILKVHGLTNGEKEPEQDDTTEEVVDPITDDMIPDDAVTIDYILSDAFDGTGNDIADATQKATAKVIGQITHIYGNGDTANTAAISDIIGGETVSTVVYFNKTEFPAEVGDIITATGTVKNYGTVRQIQDLTEVTVVSTEAEKFEPETVTIEELNTDNHIADYVLVKNVTIGAYNAGSNTTLTDADGNTINIYRGHSLPDTVKEGDTIDVYAIASKYNSSYQLRVGSADSYVFVSTGKTEEPSEGQTFADPITDDMIPSGVVTIDKVLANTEQVAEAENITVIGQLVTRFGNYNSSNSAIIEDVIDGQLVALQIYNALSTYQIGDVITVTGTRTVYGGIVQIQNITDSKLISSEKDVIDARIVDMSDMNSDNYLSQYVVMKDVTLGEYNGNGSTIITDASGQTFPIYKAATYPDGVSAGDVVDVYGVSSKYNTTYQMRVGSSTDYKVKDSIEVDSNYTLGIASIRGSFSEDLTTKYVYGDLYAENDQLDTNTKLTTSLDQIPMIATTNNDVKTRSLGTKGLAKDGYYLIETSSLGYGNMNLAFQMRGSNTGARDFNVLYSTDGKNYEAAGNTNVAANYTQYGSDSTTTNVTVDQDDTDGKFALTAASQWHAITVALPNGAANAEKLYIKVAVASETSIKGASIGNSGTNYFTTISLTGNPVIADNLVGFVKVSPEAGAVAVDTALTMTSSTKDAEIYYAINGSEAVKYDDTNKPVLTAEMFPATVVCYATKSGLEDSVRLSYQFTQAQVATVKASPNGGAVKVNTTVKLTCDTEDAIIQYSLDAGKTWNIYQGGLKLTELPVNVVAKATLEGYTDSEEVTFQFSKRTKEEYNTYFGQIHAHTNYSDGAGTPDQAFAYASEEAEHIDFLALTDHSNLFDNDKNVDIKDGSASTEWVEGHNLADQYTKEETVETTEESDDTVILDTSADAADDYFVGIMGYEMTWSGGAPGHMNTFNTDGFLSRNMDGYGNGSKTSLTNYYAQLKTVPEAFSMFNHPGTTFGDFYDFGYYDEEIDNYITLIEVGNGEGAIGSSGYFPSYEYYTRALDKGWHVAPTNDQDNHKGKWGDANTGRTVILADTLTRDNVYDALRNMRVYATEDNDLNIQYTLNGMDMGYIFDEAPDSCNIVVKLEDATDSNIGNVEVIVNGGLTAASKTLNASSGTVEFDIPANYSYYYIRVTQPDGDKAVTAPVWVSSVEALGISSLSTDASLEIAGEAINIDLGLYNNEDKDFEIDSIVYTVNGEIVHKTDLEEAGLTKLAAKGEATDHFEFTNDDVGRVTIEAVLTGKLDGNTKTYTQELTLTYINADMVTRVIVDGTHYNDYVTGYYGGNVGNFADIAAADYVQVNVVTDEITEDMLKDCALLVISAPAKKTGENNNNKYTASHFEDSFIELVKKYVADGGNVIFSGLADYQDSADGQSSTEINKLLEAIGATTRLNSDEMLDDVSNGGDNYRLYFDDFNMSSPYLAGVTSEQTYSAYSGASVLIDEKAAEALVYGHDTTYTIDSKQLDNNYVEVEKGKVVALAHERLASGSEIFVGGTVFISDFEVKSDLDNASDSYYANRNILLNILGDVKKEIPISTIAQMRAGEPGEIFAIEGYVTAGNDNANTTFFDTIYVQDETGGTTVFPFSKTVSIGTKVQLVGFVDGYQGDKEIQILSSEIITNESHIYAPKKVTGAEAMNYDANGGSLLRVEGIVTRVVTNEAGVDYFYISDGSGTDARVFIDGYILASDGVDTVNDDVKVGERISAVGLCYMNPDGTCLRVRDRDEIVLVRSGSGADSDNVGENNRDDDDDNDSSSGSSSGSSGSSQGNGSVHITPDAVPLAPIAGLGQEYLELVLSARDALLQGSVLSGYFGSRIPLLIHLGNGVGFTIPGALIPQNAPDINLSASMRKLDGFSPLFDTVQFSPTDMIKLPFRLGIQMHVGVEYAGRVAYIFNTDAAGAYQLHSIVTVNEIGNVGYDTEELTNAIVMIEK